MLHYTILNHIKILSRTRLYFPLFHPSDNSHKLKKPIQNIGKLTCFYFLSNYYELNLCLILQDTHQDNKKAPQKVLIILPLVPCFTILIHQMLHTLFSFPALIAYH